MCSLFKHIWLANDNFSSDMLRNLVSQNAVLQGGKKEQNEWERLGMTKKDRPVQPFAFPSASHRHVTKSNCHPWGDMHSTGILK